ncbi:MAG: nitrogen regulation protein NR(II) [Hydrogenophilus sp.]
MNSTASADRMLPTLDELATAVLVLDAHARITFVNAAAEHLLNRSRNQLAGQPVTAMLGTAPGLTQALDAAARSGWFYTTTDTLLSHPDGDPWHADLTVSPRPNPPGGFLVELKAVDRQRLTTEAEQRQRLQHAVQEMARAIAHEIKNPLGGIKGAAQLLALELANTPHAEYAEVIVREADRLHTLLTRLTTTHQHPHLHPTDLHQPLEQARRLIAAEYPELTITRDYDVSIPPPLLDSERFVQLFLNLLKNAAQATDGRGTITLKTRVARQVTLGKKRWRLAARIDIADNGPGIPETLRDHLFYPLVSNRPGGSGLGLAIAHEIATEHGGAIHFTSNARGTTFTVLLPIPDPQWERDR